MTALTMNQCDALFEAGYSARKAERTRATATCTTFMKISNSNGILSTKEFTEFCNEWYAGFDACTDDIVAELFEDDEYFLAKVVANKQNRAARRQRAGE